LLLFWILWFLSEMHTSQPHCYIALKKTNGQLKLEKGTIGVSWCTYCRMKLDDLYVALMMYADDHQGKLPQVSNARDYFYWIKGVKPYMTRESFPKILYCPQDEERKYPSSYISDPRLAGKKLSQLGDLSKVVLLREREFKHGYWKYALFVFADGRVERYDRDKIPSDLKFNPDLPEEEQYLKVFYYRRYTLPGFLIIITALYLIWPLKKKKENP